MRTTTISSSEKQLTIGRREPFVLVGERINPSMRTAMAQDLLNGDYTTVQREAIEQVEAGAMALDVSAGIPQAKEQNILPKLIQAVQEVVDVPLSITANSPDALRKALDTYQGRALVNALSADHVTLAAFLPIVAEYQAACVIMCSDENGIPDEFGPRVAIAEKALALADDAGISRDSVLIDPVVMPIGAQHKVGQTVLSTIDALQNTLRVNTICGVSNISIGLPNRVTLNAAFLSMLIARGVPIAITNPRHHVLRMTALAADMFMGHDENSERWLIANQRGADLDVRRVERQKERAAQRQNSD